MNQPFRINAAQADAVGYLARLYMSTATVEIGQATVDGYIVVLTDNWRWFIDRNGRVSAEDERPSTERSDAEVMHETR